MRKYPVKKDADPLRFALCKKLFKVGIGPQARINIEVVRGVVSVGGGGKNGSQKKTVATEFHGVVKPVGKCGQPRGLPGAIPVVFFSDRGSSETQRINVPPDGLLAPAHGPTVPTRPLGFVASETKPARRRAGSVSCPILFGWNRRKTGQAPAPKKLLRGWCTR